MLQRFSPEMLFLVCHRSQSKGCPKPLTQQNVITLYNVYLFRKFFFDKNIILIKNIIYWVPHCQLCNWLDLFLIEVSKERSTFTMVFKFKNSKAQPWPTGLCFLLLWFRIIRGGQESYAQKNHQGPQRKISDLQRKAVGLFYMFTFMDKDKSTLGRT